jgi:NarL family two-component system response regulator YdfI
MITEREGDVLLLLAGGCTYEQIALRLGISIHTVGSHMKNLHRKLGVRRAAHAVARAIDLAVLPQRLSSS